MKIKIIDKKDPLFGKYFDQFKAEKEGVFINLNKNILFYFWEQIEII